MSQDGSRRRTSTSWLSLVLGLVIGCGFLLLTLAPSDPLARLREIGFDSLMPYPKPLTQPEVHLVDIPRLDELGRPWQRADLARLIAALDHSDPAAIGVDMAISDNCTAASTASLQRALQVVRAPVILGLRASQEGSPNPGPAAPLALMARRPLWQAPAAIGPCPGLVQEATLALLALPGDADGLVRNVPTAGFIAGQAYPGLALALASAGTRQPAPVLGLTADYGWLRYDGNSLPLGNTGLLRFAPTPPSHHTARLHNARDVISGQTLLPPGSIVLIGTTLPEAGGLRVSRATSVHPSLHLQADAIEQLIAGTLPKRPYHARQIEAVAALLGALLATFAMRHLPAATALILTGSAALTAAGAATIAVGRGWLFDPLPLILAILITAAVTALAEKFRPRFASN